MEWEKIYKEKLVSHEEAASLIKSGDRIWCGSIGCAPGDLIRAICKRRDELKDVEWYDSLTVEDFPYFKADFKGHINVITWYHGPMTRKNFKYGNINIISTHLSQLYRYTQKVAPTVAVCEVSAPDENGYMCWGPSGVAHMCHAAKTADRIIVQVNKNCPFTYGHNNTVHVSEVACICESHHPFIELPTAPVSEEDKKIAEHILPEIPDGATIQLGIGGTANAIGYGLEGKKDLGLHSEMLTDSLVHLIKIGVINNSKKNYKPGKSVIVFGAGKKELYEFMHNNPSLEIRPFNEINDPLEIAKNDNLIAINNALMVDLTGQICSEAIGHSQFSSTGGQLDFVRGARMSKGGKAFICLPATHMANGVKESNIMLNLTPGTAVTVPRADAQYIVTEYGIADVANKTISERAKEIIKIAHPDFRDELTKQAMEARLISK